MRVGKPLATEVRHRIGLAPDNVVLDPEPKILERSAEPEDVVIGADHPDRAIALQNAAALGQPSARKAVVLLKVRKLVPLIIDAIDTRIVGSQQIAVELEIVGGIGEDEIYAGRRQLRQFFKAIADNNAVDTKGRAYPVTQTHDATRADTTELTTRADQPSPTLARAQLTES